SARATEQASRSSSFHCMGVLQTWVRNWNSRRGRSRARGGSIAVEVGQAADLAVVHAFGPGEMGAPLDPAAAGAVPADAAGDLLEPGGVAAGLQLAQALDDAFHAIAFRPAAEAAGEQQARARIVAVVPQRRLVADRHDAHLH